MHFELGETLPRPSVRFALRRASPGLVPTVSSASQGTRFGRACVSPKSKPNDVPDCRVWILGPGFRLMMSIEQSDYAGRILEGD